MTVYHPSPSGVSDQFMNTTGTTGGSGSKSGSSGDNTLFLQFLLGTKVLVTTGDLD